MVTSPGSTRNTPSSFATRNSVAVAASVTNRAVPVSRSPITQTSLTPVQSRAPEKATVAIVSPAAIPGRWLVSPHAASSAAAIAQDSNGAGHSDAPIFSITNSSSIAAHPGPALRLGDRQPGHAQIGQRAP